MLSTKSTGARRPMRRAMVASVCAWALLGIAGARIGFAADAAPAAASPGSSVAIRNFMFAPMSLQVAIGTTVTWTNFDGEPHVIRSVDDAFRSGALDQNESFSFRFDKAGTYKYVCSIHPQMVATIVVK
jgi:plastocyanin